MNYSHHFKKYKIKQMKIFFTKRFAFLLLLSIGVFQSYHLFSQPNLNLSFDNNWLFSKTKDMAAAKYQFHDQSWRTVNVPHDWSIEDTVSKANKSSVEGGFFITGTAWYRKHFIAPISWKSKKVACRFDGIFMNADVWINGTFVGHETYGYSGFAVDLTKFLFFDRDNIISIHVNNSNPPANRWYGGSGIYRHTWMEVNEPVYIPFGGTYIRTNTQQNNSEVSINTSVRNESGNKEKLTVIQEIRDKEHTIVATSSKQITADTMVDIAIQLTIQDANLWSITNPYLYNLHTAILQGNKLLHDRTEHFGIRNIAFDKDSGFILNNKKVMLKGVCIHHDAGSLGAAVPDVVYRRQLLLLKELGCNSIRLSHNPQSPVLLDLCDSLGILVIGEVFDKWSGKHTGYDSTAKFLEESERDLKYYIQRDRNRPSVILWTVGNETDEQATEKGIQIFTRLKNILLTVDSSRLISCAMHPSKGNKKGGYTNLIKYTDVVGYNYRTHDFPEWKKDFPEKVFIATETKAYLESSAKKGSEIDYAKNSWFEVEKYPFIAGQYIWAGIDYLGESMGWPRKGLTNGLLLTNGFFKPYSYFQQSIYSENPMVHIAVVDDTLAYNYDITHHWQKPWFGPPVVSNWNLNKTIGDSVTILTYSNCPKVTLYLNEMEVGVKYLKDFKDRVIKWKIPFSTGRIKAVGIKGDIQVVHELVTAETASEVHLNREVPDLAGADADVIPLIISVTDSQQRLNPLAKNKVTIHIEGDAKILGVDNGDLSDHEPYQSDAIEVREGKALVWIKTGSRLKDIIITASAKGLKSDSFLLERK